MAPKKKIPPVAADSARKVRNPSILELDPLLSLERVAELLSVTPAAIRKGLQRGLLPVPIRPAGLRQVYWRTSTIEAWIAAGDGAPSRPRGFGARRSAPDAGNGR